MPELRITVEATTLAQIRDLAAERGRTVQHQTLILLTQAIAAEYLRRHQGAMVRPAHGGRA